MSLAGASPPKRVAIIGAGVAGLACARVLAEAGLSVVMFDKGRGLGGRVSTRRYTPLSLSFDHGAQYVTARDERFAAAIGAGEDDGAQSWRPRRHPGTSRPRGAAWVGVPSMSALGRRLAAQLDVQRRTWVRELVREDDRWWLVDEASQRSGPFDEVIVAVPAPQARELLGCAPQLQAALAGVEMAPCWALMAAWREPLTPPWDVCTHDGPLAWVANDASKPGRVGPEAWVVHASAQWSRQRLDAEAADVAFEMAEALAQLLGAPRPNFARAHHWRYALVENDLNAISGDTHLYDPETGLGVCGDWCLGARVEAAYLSGSALAERLLPQRDT